MPEGGVVQEAALTIVEAVLLAGGEFGSFVAGAEAVFSGFHGSSACTTIVTVSLPPAPMSGKPVDGTVGAEYEHAGEGATETNVTSLVGKSSVMDTPVAVAVAVAEFEIVIV